MLPGRGGVVKGLDGQGKLTVVLGLAVREERGACHGQSIQASSVPSSRGFCPDSAPPDTSLAEGFVCYYV